MITRETGSGLVLAEHGQDESAITHALKRLDRSLVLQKHPSDRAEGGWIYKVFKVVSEDRPAECVCAWQDGYGRPLPLTMGLVDLVDSLRLDSRRHFDIDEHNQRQLEDNERIRRETQEAIDDDHEARLFRGQTQVSLTNVRRSPYWLRNRRPPQSGSAAA